MPGSNSTNQYYSNLVDTIENNKAIKEAEHLEDKERDDIKSNESKIEESKGGSYFKKLLGWGSFGLISVAFGVLGSIYHFIRRRKL